MKFIRRCITVLQVIIGQLGIITILCKFQQDKNTYKVLSNGWVIISDGSSEDGIPLELCSQEFNNKVAEKLGFEIEE